MGFLTQALEKWLSHQKPQVVVRLVWACPEDDCHSLSPGLIALPFVEKFSASLPEGSF